MTEMHSNDLPTRPEDLMRIIQDPSLCDERREAAWAALGKLIARIAVEVGSLVLRKRPQELEESRLEALGVIWQRCDKYDPNQPFIPWCRMVLKNWLLDRLRRRKRQPRNLSEVHGTSDSEQEGFDVPDRGDWRRIRDAIDERIDLARPLSPEDIADLQGSGPRVRVVALTVLSGLWRNVPKDQWAAWREEAGLPRDDGPGSIDQQDEAALERALGVTPVYFRQLKCRARALLRGLPFIRELFE